MANEKFEEYDYYTILGLRKGASKKDINDALSRVEAISEEYTYSKGSEADSKRLLERMIKLYYYSFKKYYSIPANVTDEERKQIAARNKKYILLNVEKALTRLYNSKDLEFCGTTKGAERAVNNLANNKVILHTIFPDLANASKLDVPNVFDNSKPKEAPKSKRVEHKDKKSVLDRLQKAAKVVLIGGVAIGLIAGAHAIKESRSNDIYYPPAYTTPAYQTPTPTSEPAVVITAEPTMPPTAQPTVTPAPVVTVAPTPTPKPTPNLPVIDPNAEFTKMVYLANDGNLYDASGAFVSVLPQYEVAEVYGENSNYYLVKANGQAGYIDRGNAVELTGRYVITDISDQTTSLYDGNKLIYQTPVVTGCVNNGTETDLGVYQIYGMEQNRWLTGANYSSFVNYWMPYNGGEGLHDANWRSEFGGEIYQYSGSHGCTNMPQDAAQKIYEYVKVGDTVVVKK